MINKKGNVSNVAMILLVIAIILMMGLFVYATITFEDVAKEKCEEAGLDLFDYTSGSIFTDSSITCINNKTKEVTKVR